MNDFYLIFASYFFINGISYCESEKPWAGIISILWSAFLAHGWYLGYLEHLRVG